VCLCVSVCVCVAVQLLLGHKKTASKFVEDNYDEFFAKFLNILKSKNNLTKRLLLRLLARAFSKVLHTPSSAFRPTKKKMDSTQCLYIVNTPYYTPRLLCQGTVSTLELSKGLHPVPLDQQKKKWTPHSAST
jgi:hypothetical protein